MYDYGIIDAQYILRRNKVTMEQISNGHLIKNKLMESFINSIMKLKRENDFIYPILCWDKSPYFKTEAVKEYKKDRHHASEEEVTDLQTQLDQLMESMMDPEKSDEEKSEISKKIAEIESSIQKSVLEMENFKVFQSVKYEIIGALQDTGFKSMIKTGFEADDFGYLLSKHIIAAGKTAVLLTVDKDWLFFQNDNVKFKSIKYPNKDYSYMTDPWNDVKDNLTLYQYGVLYEIMEGSHNNVTSIKVEDLSFSEAVTKFIKNDNTLPSYEDIKVYYNAMNVSNYEDQAMGLISHVLNPENHKVMQGKLKEYCLKNFISLNQYNYGLFTSGLPIIQYDPNLKVPTIV
jgi:hypothetical protein